MRQIKGEKGPGSPGCTSGLSQDSWQVWAEREIGFRSSAPPPLGVKVTEMDGLITVGPCFLLSSFMFSSLFAKQFRRVSRKQRVGV